MTAHFHDGVFATLRFEMVFCFVKDDAGALLQVPQYFSREIDISIQTCAYSCSAKRKLA